MKETIFKTQRQLTEYGEIFSNYLFNKGFVKRLYKELSELSDQKTT